MALIVPSNTLLNTTSTLPEGILYHVLTFIKNPQDILNFSLVSFKERNRDTGTVQLSVRCIQLVQKTADSYVKLFYSTLSSSSFYEPVIFSFSNHKELLDASGQTSEELKRYVTRLAAIETGHAKTLFESYKTRSRQGPHQTLKNFLELKEKILEKCKADMVCILSPGSWREREFHASIFLHTVRNQMQQIPLLKEVLPLFDKKVKTLTFPPPFFPDIPTNPTLTFPEGTVVSNDVFTVAARKVYLNTLKLEQMVQLERPSPIRQFFLYLLKQDEFHVAIASFVNESFTRKKRETPEAPDIARIQQENRCFYTETAEIFAGYLTPSWWIEHSMTKETLEELLQRYRPTTGSNEQFKEQARNAILSALLNRFRDHLDLPDLEETQVPPREVFEKLTSIFSQKFHPLLDLFTRLTPASASLDVFIGHSLTSAFIPPDLQSHCTNLYVGFYTIAQIPNAQERLRYYRVFMFLRSLLQKIPLEKCLITFEEMTNFSPQFTLKEALIAVVEHYLWESENFLHLVNPAWRLPFFGPTPDYSPSYKPIYKAAWTLIEKWGNYATLPLVASRFPQFADDFITSCEGFQFSPLAHAIQALKDHPRQNEILQSNLEKLTHAFRVKEELLEVLI